MEINKSKIIEINWLGNCPTCDREEHMVSTFVGNKDCLYEDDNVKCWCGQTGVIEADGQGHAWCNWDEKAVSEWDKFNIYYRQKYPEYWDLLPKANNQACSHHEELFNSWVTATAQAVPEGFLVVSSKELLNLTVAINALDLATHTESKTNEVREMWQDIALKLMALGEAQEQSHEH